MKGFRVTSMTLACMLPTGCALEGDLTLTRHRAPYSVCRPCDSGPAVEVVPAPRVVPNPAPTPAVRLEAPVEAVPEGEEVELEPPVSRWKPVPNLTPKRRA